MIHQVKKFLPSQKCDDDVERKVLGAATIRAQCPAASTQIRIDLYFKLTVKEFVLMITACVPVPILQ